MNSDLIELLSFLNQYKVKFLIIGGYAYAVHAEPRYTKAEMSLKRKEAYYINWDVI